MVASTIRYFKILFSSVWKFEGRTTCSRRLGHSFIIDVALTKTQIPPDSASLYIKWHIYRRLQSPWIGFLRHYRTRRYVGWLPFRRRPFTDYARWYTLHRCIYTSHLLSILLYWLFSWLCRKSIWTIDAPKPQRHNLKDRCVTLSQDNHTCEVCSIMPRAFLVVRWLHMFPKGRRAPSET